MNGTSDPYEGGSSAAAAAPTNPYAAASQAALTDLEATAATPPVAETPPETPLAPEVPPAPPDEPSSLKFELKVKGQTQTLTRDELIEMAQKGVDYTQKTQRVADQERQVLAAAQMLQQREQEIATFLRDPARVRTYVASLQTEAEAASVDPSDIPTQAQVVAQLKAQQAQMQQEMQAQVTASEERINTRLFEAEVAEKRTVYEGELIKTIGGLVEKFPSLDTYDAKDLDRILRADIADKVAAKIAAYPDRAVSMEEVKTLLVEAAKVRSDRTEAKIQDHIKMTAVRAAKLTRGGIEPAGGAPLQSLAPPPVKSPKLGSQELLNSVIADVNAAIAKGKT